MRVKNSAYTKLNKDKNYIYLNNQNNQNFINYAVSNDLEEFADVMNSL